MAPAGPSPTASTLRKETRKRRGRALTPSKVGNGSSSNILKYAIIGCVLPVLFYSAQNAAIVSQGCLGQGFQTNTPTNTSMRTSRSSDVLETEDTALMEQVKYLRQEKESLEANFVTSFVAANSDYDSPCGYPRFNYTSVDVKPLDTGHELWELPTHLTSWQVVRSKVITNPLFYPALTLRQWHEQARLLRLLFEFALRHNITCVGHGGIVLGALRHHGFVPWDSDIDFYIPREDMQVLLDAVEKEQQYLANEGVTLFKRPYHFGSDYIWTSTLSAPPGFEQIDYEAPTPVIELKFINPTDAGKKKCAPPLKLRQLYTADEVPFWTCQEQIDKWNKVIATQRCDAAWNHPSKNDILCGQHLVPNRSFIPTLKKKRDEHKEWVRRGVGSACKEWQDIYNFADIYSPIRPYSGSSAIGLQQAQQLIRQQEWSCYENFTQMEWTPSQIEFQVSGESKSELRRNHSIVSTRHRIVLEKIGDGTSSASPYSTSCELHLTSRKTKDKALWTKVMGFQCGGWDRQWCKITGDRRVWIQLSTLTSTAE